MRAAPYVLELIPTDPNNATREGQSQNPAVFRATRPDGSFRVDMPLIYKTMPADDLTWLWMGRIPRGQVTVIEGSPGVGKSFVALDLAARFSRGWDWPDDLSAECGVRSAEWEMGGEDGNANGMPMLAASATERASTTRAGAATGRKPGDVLLITGQDFDDAIGRRLAGLRADFARIRRFGGITGCEAGTRECDERAVALPFDIPMLERELRERSIGLIIIDPLSDFCDTPGRLDEAFRKLGELARIYKVAIVTTLQAYCRLDAQGTLRVTSRWRSDAARSVWCIVADPDDPARRLFVPRRMNFCEEPTGLPFQLQRGRVVWDPHERIDHTDPLGQRVAIRACLAQVMREGSRPAKDVFREGGLCGFNPRQLRSAAKRLGIESRKGNGYGSEGGFIWSTPERRAARESDQASGGRESPGASVGATGQSCNENDESREHVQPEIATNEAQKNPESLRIPQENTADVIDTPASRGRESTGAPAAPCRPQPQVEHEAVQCPKNRESLEKHGEFRQPACDRLPRDRYSRRQERKRRQKERAKLQRAGRR